jgi:enoyl-CoA hydratase/carnithine racemase
VIAEVHGYCLAGGGDLAALCDITIASDDAVFGYPVTKLNPHPPITLWPWVIGFKKTKELILTGRMIGAQEAHRIGLVNEVVPREELSSTVQQIAQSIALSCDKRWQKGSLNAVWERSMGVGSGLEQLADAWGADVSDDSVYAAWNGMLRDQSVKTAFQWRDDRFAMFDLDGDAKPAQRQ